jgi:ribulose-5-phosphate 4-epimerase/fuculose-1-phosphate aldolase
MGFGIGFHCLTQKIDLYSKRNNGCKRPKEDNVMTVSIDRLKKALCDGGKILVHKGLNESFGHISSRFPGEDKCLITTRDALSFTQPHEIEEVDFDGNKLTKNSPGGAPNEVFLHVNIYRARPEVKAVVRTQSPWCEIFGIRMEPVRAVHDFGAILMGETALLDEPQLADVAHVGDQMVQQLADKNAILLRGNGNVVVGGSVEEAVVRAVFLDESACLQFQARTLGDDAVRYFSSREVEMHGAALSRPDRIQRAWDNWLRLAHAGLRGAPASGIR